MGMQLGQQKSDRGYVKDINKRIKDSLKKSIWFGVNPGDKLHVVKLLDRKKKKTFECTVIREYEQFITVSRDKYTETLCKVAIQTGYVIVRRCGEDDTQAH